MLVSKWIRKCIFILSKITLIKCSIISNSLLKIKQLFQNINKIFKFCARAHSLPLLKDLVKLKIKEKIQEINETNWEKQEELKTICSSGTDSRNISYQESRESL